MSDTENQINLHDASEIDLSDKYQVQYWTYKLNCTEAELKDAVESVGSSAKHVKEFIQMLRGDKQGTS